MWRMTEDNKLENMNGPWKYSSKFFSIPNGRKRERNFVAENNTGDVLVKNKLNGTWANKVTLDAMFEPSLLGE